MTHLLHTCIVLDRSGSMEDCRTDAIGAVNSFLRQTRDDKALESRISLIIFDSQGIDVIRDRVAAADCKDLGADEYEPRASTPLLDAVGHGAAHLDKSPDKSERRVLAIMTDGLENASREFTKDTIKALLDRKQREDGWLVVYLGAGHDAWSQAGALGLSAGNVADYSKASLVGSMSSIRKRAARYAAAPSAHADALQGGFTDDERADMTDDDGSAPKAKPRR